jgi:hypothetical protein
MLASRSRLPIPDRHWAARHDRAMNRNTVRLMAAVVVGWLTGALGGLAVVPYAAIVFVFVAVLMLPVLVAFWDSDDLWKQYGLRHRWRLRMSPAERDRANYVSWAILAEIVMKRYRALWLIGPIALGLLAATTNMLGGFASIVVALDGEPVHATRIHLIRTSRLVDPGDTVECVLARPDGTRIPGGLPVPDGDVCGETEDVIVDPHGLVDPVRQRDDPGDEADAQVILLGLALVSCVPAAWPKRRNGPEIRSGRSPEPPQPGDRAARRRRHYRLRRKRRLRA